MLRGCVSSGAVWGCVPGLQAEGTPAGPSVSGQACPSSPWHPVPGLGPPCAPLAAALLTPRCPAAHAPPGLLWPLGSRDSDDLQGALWGQPETLWAVRTASRVQPGPCPPGSLGPSPQGVKGPPPWCPAQLSGAWSCPPTLPSVLQTPVTGPAPCLWRAGPPTTQGPAGRPRPRAGGELTGTITTEQARGGAMGPICSRTPPPSSPAPSLSSDFSEPPLSGVGAAPQPDTWAQEVLDSRPSRPVTQQWARLRWRYSPCPRPGAGHQLDSSRVLIGGTNGWVGRYPETSCSLPGSRAGRENESWLLWTVTGMTCRVSE